MSAARRDRAARRSFLLVALLMLLALPVQASALGTSSTAAGTPGAVTATTATGATPLTLGANPVAHQPSAKKSTKLSGGAILAAVLAALIALACLVWGLFRWRALEPHWLLSLRHSIAEAGFRASATWAEFTDWLRLGH